MGCTKKTKFITTIIIAIICATLGLMLIFGWPFLYKHILSSQLTLHDESIGYNMWKETPIPMYMDVYLFNWTNANDVIKKRWSIKPVMEELGPYVFTEHHVRVNMTWNNNETITFQQIRTWKFVPELSGGRLDDKITNLNVIAATIGFFIRQKHPVIKMFVNFIMKEKKETLLVTKTARELIFDGYDDKLLDLLKSVNISSIDVPFKKFAWFTERNNSNTYDGVFNMYTGRDNIEKLGLLDRWNGMSHVPFYPKTCGEVVGTTGELWPPVIENNTVHMFASDMCSSITLDKTSPAELHGVEGVRFAGTKRTFDNGTEYPEQACFNINETTFSGVRNISKCRFGAPAFLSFPHFYLADPVYQNGVIGLRPNKSLHELYLELEPNTGLPLNVKARVQVNILVQPISHISIYEDVAETFMPMMWFCQRATLTEDLASQVKFLLILPKLGFYTGVGITCISILLIFIVLFVSIRTDWKKNEGEKLVAAESVSTITA